MGTHPVVPSKLREQLIEDHGKNPNAWPEELRDLIDPSISVESVSPPMSGKIEKFIDTTYHYHWAGPDRDGQSPTHERVESLRYAGWEFATSRDVQMCSKNCLVGADDTGFTEEIRSGDRRLMKLPMAKWRSLRKAQNMAAIQMAYPQQNAEGHPMTSAMSNLQARTYIGEEVDVEALRARSNDSNTSMTQEAREKLARRK
jgi:hypothetical protein